jgi:hypothetical protein
MRIIFWKVVNFNGFPWIIVWDCRLTILIIQWFVNEHWTFDE